MFAANWWGYDGNGDSHAEEGEAEEVNNPSPLDKSKDSRHNQTIAGWTYTPGHRRWKFVDTTIENEAGSLPLIRGTIENPPFRYQDSLLDLRLAACKKWTSNTLLKAEKYLDNTINFFLKRFLQKKV
ncbi:MAG: hypothetical protein Q9212_002664 [Teloschistes hypoglaucus]